MKYILPLLIALALLVVGCVSNTSVDYQTGYADGSGSRGQEISSLKETVKLQKTDLKNLKSELDRKAEVTKTCLDNWQSQLQDNRELDSLHESVDKMSTEIRDLNTTVKDFNKTLNDFNRN